MQHLEGVRCAYAAVKIPADVDDEERAQNAEHMEALGGGQPRQALVHLFVSRFNQRGEGENQAVIKTPKHIVHLCAVPDADQQEHQHVAQRGGKRTGDLRMDVLFERLAHVCHRLGQRKGIENVVAHPAAQADVPAAPEVAQRNGEVRTLEVGRKLDAEELSDAGDHVDAAGEVRVLLEGVEQDAHDDDRAAVLALVAENLLDQRKRTVGDDLLFEKAPEHQQGAALDVPEVKAMRFIKLMGKLIEPRNRSLNQLREEGHEQRKACRVLFRGIFAVVYVDEVAHRLECVEADAQRQKQVERRGGLACQRRAPGEQRAHVFQHRQNAEVEQQHGEEQHALAGTRFCLVRLFLRGIQLGFMLTQIGLALFADPADEQRTRPCAQRGRQNIGQRRQPAVGVITIADQQQQNPPQAQRADVIQRRAQKGERDQCEKRHA